MATEYISRESILAKLKAKFCAYCPLPDCDANCKLHYLLDAVKQAPAADVVDVVRCKDCIYGDPDPSTSSEIFCEKHCRWLSKDHYCADGKRRQP